jgi:hydroxysqualene dehydroxylase
MKKVIIIGGGLSGLSSAVFLSEAGYEINLFEAKPFLGGRAYSFIDSKTGTEIDNGQHILMGCYPYTFKYLEKIGSFDKLKFQNNFNAKFIDDHGNISILNCSNIPAPFHILKALYNFDKLSRNDKYNLIKFGAQLYLSRVLSKSNPDTAREFLIKTGQSENIISSLWEPIIESALNGKSENISADLFRKVIFEMFFKSNKNSRIVLPIVGLSELLIEPAIKFIKNKGGQIYTNSRVKKFNIKNNRIDSIALSDGKEIKADIFISSIPSHDLAKFDCLQNSIDLKNIRKMESSPIISIYLWLDRELFEDDFVFFSNMNSQVIFNKTRIFKSKSDSNLLCIVISSAYHLINCSKEYILEVITAEFKKTFKNSQKFLIKNYRIIKERRATLLITPEVWKNRPAQKTGIDNFFLAGDWINTGLPATIESAIKSGFEIVSML